MVPKFLMHEEHSRNGSGESPKAFQTAMLDQQIANLEEYLNERNNPVQRKRVLPPIDSWMELLLLVLSSTNDYSGLFWNFGISYLFIKPWL